MRTESPGKLSRLLEAWDQLRASPLRRGAFLSVVVLSLVALLALLPNTDESAIAAAERFAFDEQMRLLQAIHPRPLANDIVLVGTDDETDREWIEPIALWHRHFADTMHALARAKPRAVGFDFVLPQTSYEQNLPGGDMAMMRGLLDLKRATRLVYVQTVDSRGRLVPVQPNYRAIVREENLGLDQHLRDPDGKSRRFTPSSGTDKDDVPTLASQMLNAIGMKPSAGYIDYSVGAPLAYVPIHQVASWDDARLQRTFGGRIVLVGSLFGAIDRWRLPTRLLSVDPGRPAGAPLDEYAFVQPGVLIHAQVIRSHLGPGMLQPLPRALDALLLVLASLTVLLRARAALRVGAAFLVPVLLLAASLATIVFAQTLLPLAGLCIAFWLALAAGGVFDAAEAAVERVRLYRSFAGQVSPAVMQEMLGGKLAAGTHAQLADVCVLFSDVRDFTTLSERMTPDVVTAVLQRYFDRMVKAVHACGGTVDKFIGDGMMVLFGAPQKLADPCGSAVQCALAMMEGLDALNEEFRAEGLPVLTIGIGVNYGTVTVGNIGSSERHNYSAIGDAVNVAARIEGLTKSLPRKILITDAVVERLTGRFHFEPLGSHDVKGHSPVRVYGIRTRPPEAVGATLARAQETA